VDGPFGSELKVSDLVRKGVPLIRIQHIGVGSFRPGFDQFISERKFTELRKHDVLPGDLVFAKLGDPPGRSTLIPSNIPRGLIVADCVRLRIDPAKVEPRFLGWSVNSPAVLQQIGGASKGSTRQRANLSDFRKLRVPVPKNREEQMRIAGLLEQADRLRRTRRYALDLSDTFLPAAFLEFFGDPQTAFEKYPVLHSAHLRSHFTVISAQRRVVNVGEPGRNR
jgi:type I restriction enzyme S subunit